jgi:RNA polymerase subunit RPABC4/transcription elongation factor Spt4
MRYCVSCKRLTAGEPLFCNHCGATYDVRLCPRLHVNPRSARICSQCGSRELTNPQPSRSFRTRLVHALLARLPGIGLLLTTILIFLATLSELLMNAELQPRTFGLLLLLALAWWAYTQLPAPIRRVLAVLLRRIRSSSGQGRG